MPRAAETDPMSLTPADVAKRAAAARALDLVTPGMRLGLGTGSTAAWFVRLLAARMRDGLTVRCVATSSATVRLAAEQGMALESLEALGQLDLTVDGADEFDPALDLIKGGGAALLQEKIVAAASARLVIVADTAKRVATLGAFPLPVEVVRFGWPVTQARIETLLAGADVGGRRVTVRQGPDGPLVTDEGHHILDLHLGRIGDPRGLATALNALPGVVEHGLFIGMAERVILGHDDGSVEEVLPDVESRTPGYVVELLRSLDA
jgi:ribose 5-phosphate isomerase A